LLSDSGEEGARKKFNLFTPRKNLEQKSSNDQLLNGKNFFMRAFYGELAEKTKRIIELNWKCT
jgi:hypothetical protein